MTVRAPIRIASTGMLVVGLLCGGVVSGVAIADPSDVNESGKRNENVNSGASADNSGALDKNTSAPAGQRISDGNRAGTDDGPRSTVGVGRGQRVFGPRGIRVASDDGPRSTSARAAGRACSASALFAARRMRGRGGRPVHAASGPRNPGGTAVALAGAPRGGSRFTFRFRTFRDSTATGSSNPRESVVNTVVIEVPTVSELAAILQPEPHQVNPSFTEEEEEPVLDALGGGGSDRAFATGQEPWVLQHRWGHKRRRASRPRFAGHPCRRPQSRRRASPPRGELHRPGRVTTPTCARDDRRHGPRGTAGRRGTDVSDVQRRRHRIPAGQRRPHGANPGRRAVPAVGTGPVAGIQFRQPWVGLKADGPNQRHDPAEGSHVEDGVVEHPTADDFGHARVLPEDRTWFKRAVFYEVLVRAFYDATSDGSGDLRGLTERLDYLKWLGVDCLWLPPFYDSPLRDGGYDIRDFYKVLPDFGTVDDFVELLDAAHRRGIRVITDLVMNHTSDSHAWFQESRRDPDGPYGDYYVWSDTSETYTRRPDHLRRHRGIELDLRPGAPAVLLAPVLLPPAGPELRQPGRAGVDARRPAVLARPRHRRLPARRRALPVRA